jgi:hypothetical protein
MQFLATLNRDPGRAKADKILNLYIFECAMTRRIRKNEKKMFP